MRKWKKENGKKNISLIMKRAEIFQKISDNILSINKDHPIRVGIDGVDAAGKTFWADELAEYLEKQGADVIRASIDGFHNPKEIRYRKGRDSAEGYYRDTTNINKLIEILLKPLGRDGNLKYKKAAFDFLTDSEIASPLEEARKDSILIFEGVFLFRPELEKNWDYKIFINADFKNTIKRAASRDQYYLGKEEEVINKYKKRYIPGQRIYLKEINPKEKADVVINNNEFNNPLLEFVA